MVTFSDVLAAIDESAPFKLQEEYDNSGLLVGELDTPLRGTLVCMDVTEAVVAEAIGRGCNLIVSHHPLIFHGLKSLRGDTERSRAIILALRAHVGILAAHTNLDAAYGGVNYAIAQKVGLTQLRVLAPTLSGEGGTGIGLIGTLSTGFSEEEFLIYIARKFPQQPCLRYSPKTGKTIERVALCGGSGIEFLDEAIRLGADAYLTGDVKYHDFQRPDGKLLLIDLGHRESELCAIDLLKQIVSQKFPTFACGVSVQEQSPVNYFVSNKY